jgi:phosphate transport system substrate-binding protein
MKMKNLCFLLFSLCFEARSSEIRIASGQAPLNNIFFPIKEAYEKKSGNKLILFHQKPEASLPSLQKGQVDVAVAGVSWKDWIQLCEMEGVHIDTNQPFRYSSIGKDVINIYANRATKLERLSKEQIENIFTGKIKNWKEVGAQGEAIKVYIAFDLTGTKMMFSKLAMHSKNYSSAVIKVKGMTEVTTRIESDKNGIAFGPHSLDNIDKKKNITIVKTPEEIARPIVFAFLNPRADIIDLKSFIASEEGQKLIKR